MRSLDGLRGVAVLTVVLYHFLPEVLPGGFLGVDVFFVLSGFLITSLLVSEQGATGRTALRDFWIRRTRRLLPALVAMLAVVGAWAHLASNPADTARLRDDGLGVLGYFANWHFIASGQSYMEQFLGAAPSPLRHAWSLAIEEQFYLVWPLVVAGLAFVIAHRRARRSTPRLRVVLGMACIPLALASSLVMALLHEPGGDPSRVYYGTDTHSQLILIGAALGAFTAGGLPIARRAPRRVLVLVGHVAAAALVVAFLLARDTSDWLYQGGYLAVAVVVITVIGAAGQPGWNPLRSLLTTRALVGLGLISYGVYLWHWPFAVWLTPETTGLDGAVLFGLRSGATLAAALLSFVLIEQPIRRGALRRVHPVLPRIAVPAVAVAILALIITPTSRLTNEPTVVARQSATVAVSARTYEHVPRCDTRRRSRSAPPVQHGVVALVGNSVAAEIAPCLDTILEDQGWALRPITREGASMCDLLPPVKADLAERAVPTAVIVYALPVSMTPCAGAPEGANYMNGLKPDPSFGADVQRAVQLWMDAGVDVVTLVPPVPRAGVGGDHAVAATFRAMADASGGRVVVGDAGTFLRDSLGVYQWFMPCLSGGEAGCTDALVAVRMSADGGIHMCTDPTWRGGGCSEEFAAGERRAAAAVARSVLAALPTEAPGAPPPERAALR